MLGRMARPLPVRSSEDHPLEHPAAEGTATARVKSGASKPGFSDAVSGANLRKKAISRGVRHCSYRPVEIGEDNGPDLPDPAIRYYRWRIKDDRVIGSAEGVAEHSPEPENGDVMVRGFWFLL
jgi:hypothetical protein